MDDFDVIVVGGGAAGLSAAITAHDAGARVIVVDGQDRLGGSTALSGGWFFAAGTSVQRAKGIVDDAEAMYDYYAQVNQWRIDPPVVRRLCAESAAAFEWLVALGVRFPVETLKRSGMETVARGHQPVGKGAEIAEVLERAARARGVEIALGNRVTGLGPGYVDARGERLTAGAVVVTTGGFGQNRALYDEWYPSARGSTFSVSAPGSQGDAFGFARDLGADICGRDRGLMIPAATLAPSLTGPLDWALLVNTRGQRFIQQDAYYSVLSAAIAAEGGRCWAIFDDALRRRAPADPSMGDLLGDHDVDEQQFARWQGRAVRAATIEALAAALDLPAPALAATVARAADAIRPAQAPFYAVLVTNAIVAVTACGLRIDAEARVLDETGEPITGLFAAGEVTGNVLGEMYIASGNSLTNCVVYGRVAGAGAAAFARARGRAEG